MRSSSEFSTTICLVQENTEAEGPTRSGLEIPEARENPLMLQGDHGPVAYRNIYFKPLTEDQAGS